MRAQLVFVGEDHDLDPVAELQFGEDAGDVGFDRGFGQEETFGDLRVRQAGGDEVEHVPFAGRQPGEERARVVCAGIDTRLRELFYWLTVLCTFALGTAAGDFAAVTLGLGTLASSFVFLGIILIPAAGYRWFRLNEVLAFWFAYTITRPLGASVADWLSVPAPYGDGLQLGTGPISLVLGILLAGIVGMIGSRHRGVMRGQTAEVG